MRTKIVNGTFHLERKNKIYLKGEIKPVAQFSGMLRIVENEGTTYIVCPIDSKRPYEGIMFPIIEDYDSLEEVK